jgi:phosphatidylglycerophosphate synthase
VSGIACVLEADDRWTPGAWRSRLGLKVAGLPLLVRQLRCLRAGGCRRVLLVGESWQDIELPAVPGVQVMRGPDTLDDLDRAGTRWLVLAADTVLDVRLLPQFLRAVSARPEPVVAVDTVERNPAVASKSPYSVGIAAPGDLCAVGDAGGFWPVGLSVTGDPGTRPTRLSVGRYAWCRVANPADARLAGWLLLLATMKRDDGLYSRWNRRISLRLTRMLIGTPLTANMATTLNAAFSTAGAFLMARGTWGGTVAGSLLLLFTCIFDGVDGEIARARYETSALGEHLDAVEGAIFYVALLTGLGVAVETMQPAYPIRELTMAGLASAVVWSLTTIVVSRRAVRRRTSSDRLYRAKMFTDAVGPLRALLRTCSFAFKRAAAGWYLALGALAGLLPFLFVPVIAAALLSGPIGLYIAALILGEPHAAAPDGQKT